MPKPSLLKTLPLALAVSAACAFLGACGSKVTASGDQTHIASEDFYAPLTQLEVPTWFFADTRVWSFSIQTPQIPELWTPGPSVFGPDLTISMVDSSDNATRTSTFTFFNTPGGGGFQQADGTFTLSPGTTDSTSTCTFVNGAPHIVWAQIPGFPAGSTKQAQCRIVFMVKGMTVNKDSVFAQASLIIGNSTSDMNYGFQVVLEHPAGTDKDSAYVKTKGHSTNSLHSNLILGKVKVEKIELTGASN